MSEIPETQRAWIIERRGLPSKALTLRTDWKVPSKLKPGEVLVKVQAAALNPVGYKLMRVLPNFAHSGRPLPAEYDLSGVIVDGNGTEFSNGDQVFGYVSTGGCGPGFYLYNNLQNLSELSQATSQGALAEYVRMPADHLVLRPPNVSPIEASGITLVGQTAYEGLIDFGQLEAGQTVLINGGSSAVGAYAIQIAKAKGAKVVATASGKNEQFVRNLGADEFIDYTKAPLHQYLTEHPPSPKFHVILDAVGLIDPSLYTHSPAYLAPNGIFVSTGPMPHSTSASELWKTVKTGFHCFLLPTWLGGTKRQYKIFLVKNKKSTLETLQKMVADGSIKPPVDSVYEFEDVLKAYDRIMSSRATGKVVVKVDPTVT
ncbi:Zinc-type alcohol dehydrogenase-like protein C16A3.02c [Hypsizygus marmoreus]|uniref:Zinc-type alcohol dehydrogenase-like protein C16A3.02c n=1 Tax=Hypsizygus marmoreus TaxID=39966 RepID=A0A369JQH6_HYPMA|nr:Zinc-type alcohol dehydrogenase-like protein C16A3.02c [Hypsizygus marmoreus]